MSCMWVKCPSGKPEELVNHRIGIEKEGTVISVQIAVFLSLFLPALILECSHCLGTL
jgi:hypothetical protein